MLQITPAYGHYYVGPENHIWLKCKYFNGWFAAQKDCKQEWPHSILNTNHVLLQPVLPPPKFIFLDTLK